MGVESRAGAGGRDVLNCCEGGEMVLMRGARIDTRRLYQGMESTFWRHFWWNGGYFGAIFWMKSLLPKPTVGVPTTICSSLMIKDEASGGHEQSDGGNCRWICRNYTEYAL